MKNKIIKIGKVKFYYSLSIFLLFISLSFIFSQTSFASSSFTVNFTNGGNGNFHANITNVFQSSQTHTVTFEPNGGILLGSSEQIVQTVNKGEKAAKLEDPTKEGYSFVGWYTSADESGTEFDFGTSLITENITLYAKWEANEYTVTFDSNGGSSVTSQTVNNGASATKPKDPTRDDYTFVNWYSDSALETEFDFGTSLITENITLYAKWVETPKQTHTVTFEPNGGSSVDSQTVNKGASATKPKDPTRDDYTFVNWYSDSALETEFDFGTPITENITLYAKWVEVYTVTFKDGNTTLQSDKYKQGEKVTPPEVPRKDGYSFVGWYTQVNGIETPFDFDKSITTDITLYAKWVETPKQTHTVTFEPNGGSSVDSQTVNKGASATKPEVPRKDGYSFVGWYTQVNGIETEFDFGTPITENITLYAKWVETPIADKVTDEEYTIQFKDWDGTLLKSDTYQKGTAVTPPPNPLREGYTFGGWFPTVISKCDGDAIYTATYEVNSIVYGASATEEPSTFVFITLSQEELKSDLQFSVTKVTFDLNSDSILDEYEISEALKQAAVQKVDVDSKDNLVSVIVDKSVLYKVENIDANKVKISESQNEIIINVNDVVTGIDPSYTLEVDKKVLEKLGIDINAFVSFYENGKSAINYSMVATNKDLRINQLGNGVTIVIRKK